MNNKWQLIDKWGSNVYIFYWYLSFCIGMWKVKITGLSLLYQNAFDGTDDGEELWPTMHLNGKGCHAFGEIQSPLLHISFFYVHYPPPGNSFGVDSSPWHLIFIIQGRGQYQSLVLWVEVTFPPAADKF